MGGSCPNLPKFLNMFPLVVRDNGYFEQQTQKYFLSLSTNILLTNFPHIREYNVCSLRAKLISRSHQSPMTDSICYSPVIVINNTSIIGHV